MEFALVMATAADSWKAAHRAEALGFDTCWFEDSQMVAADPFVVMAAAGATRHGLHQRLLPGAAASDRQHRRFRACDGTRTDCSGVTRG